MQLEEMKTLWQEMSTEIEKQKTITGTLIIKMAKAGYRSKINKILIPEIAGSSVCLAAVGYIVINFQKLTPWYMPVCGIGAMVILLLLSILSIRAVCNIQSVNISGKSYREVLLAYSKGKTQFVFVQKLSFYLSAVLMLTMLPVMGKLMGGKDFFTATPLWLFYAVAFPFFYFAAKWVFKKYTKTLSDAENILKELEGE